MRLVFASVALASLVAALPAQGAPNAQSKTMTIRLVSITTEFKLLKDKASKGEPDPGDVLWAKSTLRNEVPQFGKPKGAIVGGDIATYTVVTKTKGDLKVTARLPGGTLRTGARISEGWRRIPVLGGTGVFAGAKGYSETFPLGSNVNKARNVYRLRLP